MIALPFLFLFFVLISAIWMALDSSVQKIPIVGTTYGFFNGAFAWFVAGSLLWIIVFPHYLMKRTLFLQQRRPSNGTPKMAPPIALPNHERKEEI